MQPVESSVCYTCFLDKDSTSEEKVWFKCLSWEGGYQRFNKKACRISFVLAELLCDTCR